MWLSQVDRHWSQPSRHGADHEGQCGFWKTILGVQSPVKDTRQDSSTCNQLCLQAPELVLQWLHSRRKDPPFYLMFYISNNIWRDADQMGHWEKEDHDPSHVRILLPFELNFRAELKFMQRTETVMMTRVISFDGNIFSSQDDPCHWQCSLLKDFPSLITEYRVSLPQRHSKSNLDLKFLGSMTNDGNVMRNLVMVLRVCVRGDACKSIAAWYHINRRFFAMEPWFCSVQCELYHTCW